MDPIIHLVTNKLRLRQDTAAGKVYLERFEDGVWVTRAEVDAVAGEAGWAKYLGLTATELKAIPEPEGAAHGDILFRGSTAWTRLPAGQAGYLLKTMGSGADPVWAEPPTAGARTATVIVAAADSSEKSKQGADFTVPVGSTSAQTVINQAIGALPAVGGKVVILEGTYIVDNSILVPSNVHLEILKGATIKLKDGLSVALSVIKNADQVAGNANIRISGGGTIHGNKANTTGDQIGIDLFKVANCVLEDLTITDFRYQCISIGDASDVIVTGCLVQNANVEGMFIGTNPSRVTVTGNIFKGNTLYGAYVRYATSFVITDNIFEANGEAGLYFRDGIDSIIDGNLFSGNTTSGLNLENVSGITLTHNVFRNNLGDGAYLNTVTYSEIVSNVSRQNTWNGLYLKTCSHNTIHDNLVVENSQEANNTYDNIYLYYASSNNSIQGNVVRAGNLTNKPANGLNVGTSDCATNLVANNDCLTGGVTKGINDAGTSTNFGSGNRNNDGTWNTTPN